MKAAQSFRTAFIPILIALGLCEFVAAFETSMVYAAMSKLVQEFGDPAMAGWLVTGYFLMGAGTAAVIGRFGDIYGRRSVILMMLALGLVGSLISAFSTNFTTVLAGRLIQGFTAAMIPLCFGLIREHLPERWVSLGVGLIVSAAGAGTVSALLIGGIIVDNFPWRTIFTVSVILTAVSIVASWAFIPKSHRQAVPDRPDYVGGLLYVPGIALALLAISKGTSWGWTSATTIGCLLASLVFLGGWVFQSLRHPTPLVNVRLFANRNILLANIAMSLLGLGALQIILVFSLLLQQPEWTGAGLGASATGSAIAITPSNIVALAAGPLAGIIAFARGDRTAVFVAGLITAVGWFGSLWLSDTVLQVTIILIVVAFGTAMAFAALPNVVVKAAPLDRTSEAVGMMQVMRATCMSAGAQLVAVLLAVDGVVDPDTGAKYPSRASYELVFSLIGALCLAVCIIALFLKQREPAGNTPPIDELRFREGMGEAAPTEQLPG